MKKLTSAKKSLVALSIEDVTAYCNPVPIIDIGRRELINKIFDMWANIQCFQEKTIDITQVQQLPKPKRFKLAADEYSQIEGPQPTNIVDFVADRQSFHIEGCLSRRENQLRS